MTHTTATVTTTPLTRIADDNGEVAVRRVETPKGTRVEFEATESGTRIRLGAVSLECLTWQDESTFADFLDAQHRPLSVDALSVQHGLNDDSIELTRITNEFGHAELRVSDEIEHDRLEIHAPKQGFSIGLNPTALEGVTWQDQETVTALIRERLE